MERGETAISPSLKAKHGGRRKRCPRKKGMCPDASPPFLTLPHSRAEPVENEVVKRRMRWSREVESIREASEAVERRMRFPHACGPREEDKAPRGE